MYGCKSWTVKKAEHWRIDAFELWCWRRLLRESQEISPEYSFRRTDTEAQTPILWLPYEKNWLIGKDPDAGKDWRQEEKGMTEDEMVGWDHQLSGHKVEQAPGGSEGQGSLACCSPWGHKSQIWLSDWKTTSCMEGSLSNFLKPTSIFASTLLFGDWAICIVHRGLFQLDSASVIFLVKCLKLGSPHGSVENSERDGNTRPPDPPLEKPVCRSGSNS